MAVSTWSPDPIPQIAIGSAAGAIDSSFSASAQLEIHDLNLNLKSKQTIKLTTTLVPSK